MGGTIHAYTGCCARGQSPIMLTIRIEYYGFFNSTVFSVLVLVFGLVVVVFTFGLVETMVVGFFTVTVAVFCAGFFLAMIFFFTGVDLDLLELLLALLLRVGLAVVALLVTGLALTALLRRGRAVDAELIG